MAALSRSHVPRTVEPSLEVPFSILRTETVLSRFPVHNLTQGREVTIHLTRQNAQGTLELRWDVSHNARYGPPGPLAYKLDTLVINQILDGLPRPLPRVLKVGSLRQVSDWLGVQVSGREYRHLTQAFHQNASAYIVAYVRYHGRDGLARTLNAGFTRYSVVFTGEHLPDGTPADAVYLVLSEPYWEVLNAAPVRPVNYAYLKVLTPVAQRFYEMVSYKVFAALKYRHPSATLRYAEYCLLATQPRHTDVVKVQKQMYKVHRPHLDAGYLTKVRYEATTDEEGRPDWRLHYTPGPRARAEYAAFQRQPGPATDAGPGCPEDAEQTDLLTHLTPAAAAITPPPLRRHGRSCVSSGGRLAVVKPASAPERPASEPPQAEALVQQFYQRFHGLTGVTPSAKEVEQATDLLATYGEAMADFLLTYAHAAARETQYQPQVFGGILHYLPRALAASEARTAQVAEATTRQAEVVERTQHEQYAQWRQQALGQLRATLPAEALAALEAAQQARLVAEGTAACALPFAVRLAVDAVLEAQAGLPTLDTWVRQARATTPAAGAGACAICQGA